ncbi:MAG: 3-deoxy-manno-octulosonate cytidylyltransferase [Prevotella sp.]|nr:3-deoxy-manno-octulosonate cytidylyltransferase [Prevotella sp.]
MQKRRFIGIIPARYASTRFPGKPLAMLGGKSVISRVYEQVSRVLGHVYVATDDERIFTHVSAFGGRAVMTSVHHQSGTDRIQEAMAKIGASEFDVVVNVQGDEPFIQRSQIETVMACFEDERTQIATLGMPFTARHSLEDLENPNSPKIVLDNDGYALYFSRSVVPFVRSAGRREWMGRFPFLKHIGLYAYRTDVLSQITALPPSALELAESLEQLRWLQNGFRVKVGITSVETIGIDTPEDLMRAEQLL